MGKHPTGIARYAASLFHELTLIEDLDLQGLFPLSRITKSSNVTDISPMKFYSSIDMIKKRKLDLIHTTDFKVPHYFKNIISTVHDVFLFTKEGSRFATKEFKKKKRKDLESIISRSQHIITVSETTKIDLNKNFNVDLKNISVTHLGIPSNLFEENATKPSSLDSFFSRPFLLFVGAISERKNIESLIQAYSNSRARKDYNLILVGHLSSGSEKSLDLVKKLNLGEKVFFLQHVSDIDLINLYDQSSGLVFPTYYEGFGIPPLEAMARKKPVLAGNRGATKEVLGNNLYYCDPHELDSIQEGIEKLCDFPKDWIELNYNHAKSYTWSKTAISTFDVYKKTIERGLK